MQSKKVLTSTLCTTALLLGAQGLQAAEDVGQVYVKALGTYIDADSERLVDDEVAGGTRLALAIRSASTSTSSLICRSSTWMVIRMAIRIRTRRQSTST
jgi:hypothetical protein